ncbi:MAG: PAS domain S-box protein, partial [Nitrospiraceae bacterium]
APHLPVIALAGAVPNDAVAAALDLGARAFMQEPYDVEVANALLRRVLTLSRLSSRAEEAERLAHDQREQCCALMEHTPDAVVLADHRGRIVQWNRSAQRLFAYTADDVLGRPLTLLMPERYRADHQQGLARFRFTGIPRNAGTTITLHG